MALTPDGKSLLGGRHGGKRRVLPGPGDTGETQRRATISDPYQLQFSPDGKWMVVAGLARNQIDIYDAATLTLAHRVPASSMPSHINYSPDSSVAYVSLQGTDALMAIDVRSGAVLWDAKVGARRRPGCYGWMARSWWDHGGRLRGRREPGDWCRGAPGADRQGRP